MAWSFPVKSWLERIAGFATSPPSRSLLRQRPGNLQPDGLGTEIYEEPFYRLMRIWHLLENQEEVGVRQKVAWPRSCGCLHLSRCVYMCGEGTMYMPGKTFKINNAALDLRFSWQLIRVLH